MKRIAAIFNIWVISALAPAWDGARIEKVDAYSNQAKSSVVIFYSGADKLRFFAIDSADGLLTLDFPGVYSDVDFSGLQISQIIEVSQAPLDPDVSKGISVRFHLKPGVAYEIFDGASGELTLLFETGDVTEVAADQNVEQDNAPVEAPSVTGAIPEATQRVLEGRPGSGLLGRLSIDAGQVTGRIKLDVQDLKDYRTFYLESPNRFVLDLKQTALSLESGDLLLNLPLVKGLRVKQFQSAPEPIVRVVMDLNQRVEVKIFEDKDGLLLFYAADQQGLQDLFASTKGSSENENTSILEDGSASDDNTLEVASEDQPVDVKAVEPEEESVPSTDPDQAIASLGESAMGNDAIAEMEKVVDPVPSVMLQKQQPQVQDVVSEEVVVEEGPGVTETSPSSETSRGDVLESDIMSSQKDEAVLAVNSSEDQVLEEKPIVVDPPVTTDAVAVIQDQPETPATTSVEDDIQETPSPKPEEYAVVEAVDSNDREVVAEVPVEETPGDETPEVEQAAKGLSNQANALSDPSQATEEPVLPSEEPVFESHGEAVVSNETADNVSVDAEVASFVSDNLSVDDEVASFVSKDDPSDAAGITEAGDLSEPQNTATSETAKPMFYDESVVSRKGPTDFKTLPEDESFQDPSSDLDGMPKFEMAGEVDTEMQAFLDKKPDKSFYGMMKDVRSTHREIGQVVVTNSAISNSKALTEMRSMQEDEEVIPGEDFTALFKAEEDIGVETLTGENKDYKGFEISIIDVKDADVVDLLRFIADQVGINLYVDSSVPPLTATYRFRNIPWDQALEIILANANLDKEFRNGVLRVATMEKFRAEEVARALLRTQRELNVPRETVTFSLNYAKAEDVLPLVENYLSARGNILMDERTNMLIIQDIPSGMTTIRALIKKLDRMIAQVSIEARLVETTKRFLRELGIQWGLSAEYSPEQGTDSGLDFPNRLGVGGPDIGSRSPGGLQGGYAVNLPVVAENASGIGLTLGNFLDNFKLDVSLQMLESEGFGQIISSPKITTQNNKTALIKNGQKVPIQTIQRGTITVTYIDAVLELQVTPHITSDETVIMDVVVDKSEPDFTRTVDGNPVINIRRAETKVLVKNGGTAVIGGIFTLNEQNSEDGIPGLRKIPFIQRLFSHELTSYENQELLIFVTPRIVKY